MVFSDAVMYAIKENRGIILRSSVLVLQGHWKKNATNAELWDSDEKMDVLLECTVSL